MKNRSTLPALIAGFLFLSCIALPVSFAQDEKKPETKEPAAVTLTNTVYRLEVRVIFGGTSGIKGNVPRELLDMRAILPKYFDYPSFDLTNTIQLSLFADEGATALVFPEHYIRIIPKGAAGGSGLKVKTELYEVKQGISEERFFSQGDLNLVGSKEETETEGQHKPVFPIMASAMLLTADDWETIGGVPVYVNTKGRVSGSSLSTSPLSHTSNPAQGELKYLILGLKLAGIKTVK